MAEKTPLGIIEGFYGRYYEHAARQLLSRELAARGYSFYIFAPKNFAPLRRAWREAASRQALEELTRTARDCTSAGLKFGFGISPLNINHHEAAEHRLLCELTLKLTRHTGASLVGLLFDDIPGDDFTLARAQQALISRLRDTLPSGVTLIVCPTYYSFDPVLTRLFGEIPPEYFADLTAHIAPEVEFFWTGNQVVSVNLSAADMERGAQALGRRVALWDNYPVNDGRRLCTHLFTHPFPGRQHLNGVITRHACNPMNEALWSLPALASLAAIYQGGDQGGDETASERAAAAVISDLLAGLMKDDTRHFHQLLRILDKDGLEGLRSADTRALAELVCELEARGNSQALPMAAAAELRGLLAGNYAFDPACLTD